MRPALDFIRPCGEHASPARGQAEPAMRRACGREGGLGLGRKMYYVSVTQYTLRSMASSIEKGYSLHVKILWVLAGMKAVL